VSDTKLSTAAGKVNFLRSFEANGSNILKICLL